LGPGKTLIMEAIWRRHVPFIKALRETFKVDLFSAESQDTVPPAFWIAYLNLFKDEKTEFKLNPSIEEMLQRVRVVEKASFQNKYLLELDSKSTPTTPTPSKKEKKQKEPKKKNKKEKKNTESKDQKDQKEIKIAVSSSSSTSTSTNSMIQKMQAGYPIKRKDLSGYSPSVDVLTNKLSTPSVLGFYKNQITSKYQTLITTTKRHMITRIAKEIKNTEMKSLEPAHMLALYLYTADLFFREQVEDTLLDWKNKKMRIGNQLYNVFIKSFLFYHLLLENVIVL